MGVRNTSTCSKSLRDEDVIYLIHFMWRLGTHRFIYLFDLLYHKHLFTYLSVGKMESGHSTHQVLSCPLLTSLYSTTDVLNTYYTSAYLISLYLIDGHEVDGGPSELI